MAMPVPDISGNTVELSGSADGDVFATLGARFGNNGVDFNCLVVVLVLVVIVAFVLFRVAR